jgi:hypothetical protein
MLCLSALTLQRKFKTVLWNYLANLEGNLPQKVREV